MHCLPAPARHLADAPRAVSAPHAPAVVLARTREWEERCRAGFVGGGWGDKGGCCQCVSRGSGYGQEGEDVDVGSNKAWQRHECKELGLLEEVSKADDRVVEGASSE